MPSPKFKYAVGRPFHRPPRVGNLVSNYGAETDASGWTVFDSGNVTLSRITSTSFRGSACFEITSTGSSDARMRTTTSLATVTGKGTRYRARCWVKAPTGNTAVGKTFTLQVAWFPDDYLSLYSPGGAQTQVVLTDAWQEVSAEFVAGVGGYTKVHPVLGIYGVEDMDATDIVHFDQVELYRCDDLGLIAGDFLVPSVYERPTGETDAGLRPANNLFFERLARAWRSSGISADAHVSAWFGKTAVLPAAVFVEAANVATITIESAATLDGAVIHSQDFTLPRNADTLRYSGLCEISQLAAPASYWRIKIDSATAPIPENLEYFQIGRVTWLGALHEMDQNWGLPLDLRSSRAGGHVESGDAALDSTDLSEIYAVLNLTGMFAQNFGDDIVAQLRVMKTAGNAQRILKYENKGDISRAWLCAKIGEMAMVRESWPNIRADLVLREVL